MGCEHLKGRRRELCEGTAQISLERINLYRATYWNLPPLTVETRPIVYSPSPEPPRPKQHLKLNLYGPGSVLIDYYGRNGVPHCEACFALAYKMDTWGPDECESRLEEIIEDMLPRARQWVKENKPWIHKLLPGIIKDIRINDKLYSDVKFCIEESRRLIAAGETIKLPPKKQKHQSNPSVARAASTCPGCGH